MPCGSLRSLLLSDWPWPPANGARAQTDDYPSRTVTFICPFPAGGGTDILVRLLAAELQDKLKRPVIVDNRVGAGTRDRRERGREIAARRLHAVSRAGDHARDRARASTRSCPTTR